MIPFIAPLDPAWFHRAAEHQARLTMPAGALGRLLPLGQQLCAIQETLQPQADPAAVAVLAADHGVAEEGVSAYPQEVTGQMVANFVRGGAAINVLARRTGARVLVADLGVKFLPEGLASQGDWLRCPLGPGTRNFVHEPAMTAEQVGKAFAFAGAITERLAGEGVKVIALGEMGIGNTTAASALTAALTSAAGNCSGTRQSSDPRNSGEFRYLAVEQITGRGTGVDDERWRRKCEVIARALALHRPDPEKPLGVLTALGGFEIAGLAGLALHAAARRLVVVLDGFISSVGGLVAVRIAPHVRQYLIASHCGVEIGHRVVLEALDLKPLLDLGLRLGEGTGAVLALPILQSAADLMRDMATFASAGVSGGKEP